MILHRSLSTSPFVSGAEGTESHNDRHIAKRRRAHEFLADRLGIQTFSSHRTGAVSGSSTSVEDGLVHRLVDPYVPELDASGQLPGFALR